jgi:hypothetical protein
LADFLHLRRAKPERSISLGPGNSRWDHLRGGPRPAGGSTRSRATQSTRLGQTKALRVRSLAAAAPAFRLAC